MRRPHVGSPTSQLVASRDEYREHIEAQDLDAELLTFLAGVVDSIGLELLYRVRRDDAVCSFPPSVRFHEDPRSAMEVVASWGHMAHVEGDWSNFDAGIVDHLEGYLNEPLESDEALHLRLDGRAVSYPLSILRTVRLVRGAVR